MRLQKINIFDYPNFPESSDMMEILILEVDYYGLFGFLRGPKRFLRES